MAVAGKAELDKKGWLMKDHVADGAISLIKMAGTLVPVVIPAEGTEGTAAVPAGSIPLGFVPVGGVEGYVTDISVTDTTVTVTMSQAATRDNIFNVMLMRM